MEMSALNGIKVDAVHNRERRRGQHAIRALRAGFHPYPVFLGFDDCAVFRGNGFLKTANEVIPENRVSDAGSGYACL